MIQKFKIQMDELTDFWPKMDIFDAAHDINKKKFIKKQKYSKFPNESFTFHQKTILGTSHHYISCECFKANGEHYENIYKSNSSNTHTYT